MTYPNNGLIMYWARNPTPTCIQEERFISNSKSLHAYRLFMQDDDRCSDLLSMGFAYIS